MLSSKVRYERQPGSSRHAHPPPPSAGAVSGYCFRAICWIRSSYCSDARAQLCACSEHGSRLPRSASGRSCGPGAPIDRIRRRMPAAARRTTRQSRAVLINAYRASTSAARARIIARSACAPPHDAGIGTHLRTRPTAPASPASSRSCLLAGLGNQFRVRRGLAESPHGPSPQVPTHPRRVRPPPPTPGGSAARVPKTRLRSF